ncbi:MAG: peptidylprolyl isomerase, partial [Clostridia bacterium]|nr:peptidylprolyl isomerase [Clostridia bacterium]
FIRVKQILVGEANSAVDQVNLEKAQDIKSKLDAGADFDELCREFNNDLYMFENDDGYYIMRGTRNFEFEEAAFALAVGETSDVVKIDVGYSIIKRYEKDAEYITENFDELTSEYYESVYSIMYEEKYEELSGELVSLPDAYDVLDVE